ncbi:MAG: hypothetical protein QM704_26080 [Anaeromyxobacteraceae bacterium]
MQLRRMLWMSGAVVALLAGPACQRSDQDRARAERKDVADAQKDVNEKRKDLAEERRDHQADTAKATRDEREDLAKAQAKERKEETEAEHADRAATAGSTSVTGRIVRSSGDELVLRPAGETRDVHLKVDSGTSVTVDGKRSSTRDLREGTEVRAAFSEKDGDRHATRIEVTK